MCHNTISGGQNDLSELATWQKVDNPFLDVIDVNIESGGNDSAFVETTIELDHNFLGAVVIDNFEFTNISVLLHTLQKLDNNLTGRSDKHLTLSALFSVCDCFQTIRENRHAHHLDKFFFSINNMDY
mmetsp:Transcript_32714/g.62515  ORF Transcript_32714/g.62515 Transcript_32714/m.62515 type:complete len:127 (+) Transcript_32714:160-540(+)